MPIIGKISQIMGAVVDVVFEDGQLPETNFAAKLSALIVSPVSLQRLSSHLKRALFLRISSASIPFLGDPACLQLMRALRESS